MNYKSALKQYLTDGGEDGLKNAYLLGRQALERRVSALGIVVAHHQMLASQLAHAQAGSARQRELLARAAQFLAEYLSSFEMAQRGFRESLAELNSLNARLESEVERRTQAMRESEERYRTLIEISPDAITMTDLDGKVTFCNQHAAELHGCDSPAELLDFRSAEHIAPEDLPRLSTMAHKVLQKGVVGMAEYALIRMDGQRIPVEVRVSLVRDASGRPVGFLGVNRDISERSQVRQKLESQARQQTLVAELGQHALSGIALNALMSETSSLVVRALEVEFCALLEFQPGGQDLQLKQGQGWKPGSVGSQTISAGPGSQAAFMLLEDEPVIIEDLARERRFTPPAFLFEHSIAAGIAVTIQGAQSAFGILGAYTARPRKFTVDEVNFLCSTANILAMAINNRHLLETEAEARQKAEQNNEARLKALAIISHELRTPLTSIKGFASTLLAQDVTWGVENQRDFIQTINEEADKLSALIEQILDLSKMEAGAFRFAPSRQPASSLVAAAMIHLRAICLQHRLTVDIPPSLPDIWADPQRVAQVLENLVENATKYAPPGSEISLSAQCCSGFVEITVADQGPGIRPEESDTVFQPFYRTADPITLTAHGAGLGLTICRRLVEAMGGRIWVHERTEPGAVISFTVPLAPELQTGPG